MCRCVCVTVQLFSTVFNCQNKPTKGCLLQSCSWNGQESLSPVITAKPECLQACRARGGGIHKVHGWKETGKEIIWKKTSKKKKAEKKKQREEDKLVPEIFPTLFPNKTDPGQNQGAPAATAVLFSSSSNMGLKSNLQQHTWWGIKSAFSR